jgi:pSer/pThr/pTyr-binding forkhead associated (FHA) protein
VRDVKASQRRRRLRLIKTIEALSITRFHAAASALAIASDTASTRLDTEAMLKQMLKQMLVECRAKTSVQLRVEHPGTTAMTVTMNRPFLLIGRDPACDLRLDHEDIKPRHCILQWIDGHLFCGDVGPRTTLFPGRRSQDYDRWVAHEPIQIGPYQLSLVDDDIATPPDFCPLDRSPRLATEYPQLGLQFQGVEQSDNLWPVNRILTMIGRGSQCKLRLNHSSMAHVQACLLRTQQGCWLIDLMTNGTTGVNGRPIAIAPIDVGDILELGPFRIEVTTTVFSPIEVARNSKVTEGILKTLPPIKLDRAPGRHPQWSGNPLPPSATILGQNTRDERHDAAIYDDASLQAAMTAQVIVCESDAEPAVARSWAPLPPPKQLETIPQTSVTVASQARDVSRFASQAESRGTVPEQSRTAPSVPRPFTTAAVAPPTVVPLSPFTQEFAAMPASVAEVPTAPKPVDKTLVVSDPRNPSPVDNLAAHELIAAYIASQQAQIAELKSRLDQLKDVYDTAAGQLISQRMRDTLEKPVVETMLCLEGMQASVNQLIKSVEPPSL